MKRIILNFLIIVIFCGNSVADSLTSTSHCRNKVLTDNSFEISSDTLNKVQVGNLKCLGLVWGFLKYYHPNVAEGHFNWDEELINKIPDVLSAQDKNQLSSIFVDWIHKLGNFKENGNLKPDTSDVVLFPDLDWINHSDFSPELQSLLNKVKKAKRSKVNYYVDLDPKIGNPEFEHEEAYSDMLYPNLSYRLLALFRYWNIVQYFYPYKDLIQKDWKNILEAFIPETVEDKDRSSYILTMLKLIGQIHDSHANIYGQTSVLRTLDQFFGVNVLPVQVTFINDKPVVTGFLDEKLGLNSGLKVGDEITEINHQSMNSVLDEKLKYTPASNRVAQLRNLSINLLRSNDSIINISFVRDGQNIDKSVKTYSIHRVSIYGETQNITDEWKILDHNIAYINHGTLKRKDLPEIWKKIENTKGLIIDDRNYPSDFPLLALGEYLVPRKTAFATFTKGSIESPGLFQKSNSSFVGDKNNNYYKGKVIVLVNETTQSAAEFSAMAYKVVPHGLIVGSTTAGADGNVSKFYLPGGIITMISGIGVYYPNGKVTQRVGIVPDVIVKPSIQGIREKKDEVLDKAIKLILEN